MAAMDSSATTLKPGQAVRILAPPNGASFAKFRQREGVIEYALPGEDDAWVVAVLRRKNERASGHVVRTPENDFEFIPVEGKDLEVIKDEVRAPNYHPAARIWAPEDDADLAERGVPLEQRPRARKVGIIVPFRDNHAEQKRAEHLGKFVPHMARFLATACEDHRVYVIEQSDDTRKFNRGQLLNVGATLAVRDGCDSLIFHDVDLLPSDDLGAAYSVLPLDDKPLHIARVWDRYSGNADYFGGVCAWTAHDFSRINGFPNNYWGWGGEDDEMMRRCRTVFGKHFTMEAPPFGSLEDLEGMSIDEKVSFLRSHRDWKCNVRWELRDKHATTWAANGLRRGTGDLPVEVLTTEALGNNATKHTVSLQLSNDWTDAKAGADTDG